MKDNHIARKIIILNTGQDYLVPNTSIEPVNNPDPSDIRQHPNNTNKSAIIKIMNQKKMKKIWETLASNFIVDERLFFHWHILLEIRDMWDAGYGCNSV